MIINMIGWNMNKNRNRLTRRKTRSQAWSY